MSEPNPRLLKIFKKHAELVAPSGKGREDFIKKKIQKMKEEYVEVNTPHDLVSKNPYKRKGESLDSINPEWFASGGVISKLAQAIAETRAKADGYNSGTSDFKTAVSTYYPLIAKAIGTQLATSITTLSQIFLEAGGLHTKRRGGKLSSFEIPANASEERIKQVAIAQIARDSAIQILLQSLLPFFEFDPEKFIEMHEQKFKDVSLRDLRSIEFREKFFLELKAEVQKKIPPNALK